MTLKFKLRAAFAACAAAALSLTTVGTVAPPPPNPPTMTADSSQAFTSASRAIETFDGIRLNIQDDDMLDMVKAGLTYLKNKAPTEYEFVKDHINEIRQAQRSGMHVRSGIFDLSKVSANSVEWTAAVIYHDSIHVYEYRNGLPFTGEEGERYANELQLAMMERIKAPQYMIDHLKNVMSKGDHSDLDGDGQYTYKDYMQRQWFDPPIMNA